MKPRKMIFVFLLATLAVPLAVPVFAATGNANDNPPGPAGGPGTNWAKPPAGERPHRQLTEEQRAKLKAMTPEQRQAFFQRRCESRMKQRFDRDNNPPGPRGGPGTNWENPPGPRGGPGASPDR